MSPDDLDPAALAFLTERHLATLTTIRADGTPHVVAVGFTWDPDSGLARVITRGHSVKVRNIASAVERGGVAPAAVCQVAGPYWLTMEGSAVVTDDPDRVAEAVRRYEQRYRLPGDDPGRVAIEITVQRVLGRWA